MKVNLRNDEWQPISVLSIKAWKIVLTLSSTIQNIEESFELCMIFTQNTRDESVNSSFSSLGR